jgi:hypothetical protein
MTPRLIYIAGPYRGANAWEVEQNIREAERWGIEVAKLGAYPVIPHSNTRGYFEHVQSDPNFWLGGTLELMRRCDGVFLTPTWNRSSGARAEAEEAVKLHMPIFTTLERLEQVIKQDGWPSMLIRRSYGGMEVAFDIKASIEIGKHFEQEVRAFDNEGKRLDKLTRQR